MEHKHKKNLVWSSQAKLIRQFGSKAPKSFDYVFFCKKNVHVHRSGNNEVKSERYREDKK